MTITNGNHVKIQMTNDEAGQSQFCANLSDFSRNINDYHKTANWIKPEAEAFHLEIGDVVKQRILNFTATTTNPMERSVSLFLMTGGGEMKFGENHLYSNSRPLDNVIERTITISEENHCSVYSACAWMAGFNETGLTLEFDLEYYVNNERIC